MSVKNFFPLLIILFGAVLSFFFHRLIFNFTGLGDESKNFYYPLEQVYLYFLVCSVIIVLILIIIRWRNINNVGFTFLLLTFAKMGVAYAILHPVIERAAESLAKEKINFFIVFAVFLALETIATIRLLNKW